MGRIENIAQTLTNAFLICILTISCNEAAGDHDIAEQLLLDETDSGENSEDAGVSFYVGPIIEIDPDHQICEIDSDCTTAMTHCSCHCGEAVHNDYWMIYLDKQDEACSDYEGKMCGMLCEEEPVCIESKCVLAEPE